MKRGRNQRRRPGGSNPNRALDSNGPDVRIRGTANQIYDKYLTLARDASSAGDRVKAESYLQHAEHYFRVIRAMQPAQTPVQPSQDEDDSDQPAMEGDENNARRERPGGDDRRSGQRRNGAPADAEQPAVDESEPEAEASADAGEDEDGEDKKPRRRRAARRPVRKSNDADAEGDSEDAAVAAE